MKCPKYGSKKIKSSHSRGFKERLQKLFNQKPYRCIDCGWRGILKTKSFRTKRDVKKYILVNTTI
jgi:DNA-directed RNA polymerase subunit RPC12/RpoP